MDIDSAYYPRNYGFQVLDDHRFLIFEEYVDSMPLSNCLDNYSEPYNALTLLYG